MISLIVQTRNCGTLDTENWELIFQCLEKFISILDLSFLLFSSSVIITIYVYFDQINVFGICHLISTLIYHYFLSTWLQWPPNMYLMKFYFIAIKSIRTASIIFSKEIWIYSIFTLIKIFSWLDFKLQHTKPLSIYVFNGIMEIWAALNYNICCTLLISVCLVSFIFSS